MRMKEKQRGAVGLLESVLNLKKCNLINSISIIMLFKNIYSEIPLSGAPHNF